MEQYKRKVELLFQYTMDGEEKTLLSVRVNIKVANNFTIKMFRDSSITSLKMLMERNDDTSHLEMEPSTLAFKCMVRNVFGDYIELHSTPLPSDPNRVNFRKIGDGVWLSRYHPTIQDGQGAFLKGYCGDDKCYGIKLSTRSIRHFVRFSSIVMKCLKGSFVAL